MAKVFVYSDNSNVLSELITGAQAISGEKPAAIVLENDQKGQEVAAEFGADTFLLGAGGAMAEDYVETIEALVRDKQPAGLFFGTTPTCRAISARLAARLGINAFSDVKYMDENFVASQMVYGGGADRKIKSTGDQFIALFGPSSFVPAPTGDAGTVTPVDYVQPAWTATVISSKTKDSSSVDLTAAKSIIGVGRGLAEEDDLAMINELAGLLGAEVGCTRPIAENNGWLPKESYIGISGAFVKPDLFVGVGISGQVQHTVGVADAKTIVTINKDKACPYMSQSDYGVAMDLYDFVPALIDALKQRG